VQKFRGVTISSGGQELLQIAHNVLVVTIRLIQDSAHRMRPIRSKYVCFSVPALKQHAPRSYLDAYKDGSYLEKNPTWHVEESSFKVKYIMQLLRLRRDVISRELSVGRHFLLKQAEDFAYSTARLANRVDFKRIPAQVCFLDAPLAPATR
jgi:hypothetical protein